VCQACDELFSLHPFILTVLLRLVPRSQRRVSSRRTCGGCRLFFRWGGSMAMMPLQVIFCCCCCFNTALPASPAAAAAPPPAAPAASRGRVLSSLLLVVAWWGVRVLCLEKDTAREAVLCLRQVCGFQGLAMAPSTSRLSAGSAKEGD